MEPRDGRNTTSHFPAAHSSRPAAERPPAPAPHPPPRYSAQVRIPLDNAGSAKPAVHLETPPTSHRREEPAQIPPAEEPRAATARPRAEPQVSPRTRTERNLMAALLLGLGLIAVALVMSPALTRSDRALGVTVLLAGVALLALMELCRRTCPPRR